MRILGPQRNSPIQTFSSPPPREATLIKLRTLLNFNMPFFFPSDAHYYLNLDRCAYGGIRPVGSPMDNKEMVRGAEIVAVNQNCSTVYYHAEGWFPYETGRDIVCTAHP